MRLCILEGVVNTVEGCCRMQKYIFFLLTFLVSFQVFSEVPVHIETKINKIGICNALDVNIYFSAGNLRIIPRDDEDMKGIIIYRDATKGTLDICSEKKINLSGNVQSGGGKLEIYIPEPVSEIHAENASCVAIHPNVASENMLFIKAGQAARVNFNGVSKELTVKAAQASSIKLQGHADTLIARAVQASSIMVHPPFTDFARVKAKQAATIDAQGISVVEGECTQAATVIVSKSAKGLIKAEKMGSVIRH